MSKSSQISAGFTLIEIIVVIVIISILLIFSFPLLNNIQLLSPQKKGVEQLSQICGYLRKQAIQSDANHYLWININASRFWITHDRMSEEEAQSAQDEAASLPESVTISRIQIVNAPESDQLSYRVRFHKLGYSDYVIIHLMEEDAPATLEIQPFLSTPKIIDRHIEVETCI